jgi:hypothetical protein
VRKTPTKEHLKWARAYKKRTGRVPFPFPQPQPKTPLRGDVTELTFGLYRRARRGTAPAAVQKLFDKFGSYRVKPKRGSRGVIWNNQPFYWSAKGYYRPGFGDKRRRRPVQHYIWERHHRRKMPEGYEIFFLDRDRHNFEIDNLELLSKSALHKRTLELGESRQLTREERILVAGTRWTRYSRRATTTLLANFNSSTTPTRQQSNGHSKTLQFLAKRRQVITHGSGLPSKRSAPKAHELKAA